MVLAPSLRVMKHPRFIVVAGPTASGKSDFSLRLAKALDGVIICCDSVQLYRGFDIGSAKPSVSERQGIPHYLFDTLNWDQPYDAARYAFDARQVIDKVKSDGQYPILVGGTGLYLRALLGDAWDDKVPSDDQLRGRLAARESGDLYKELMELDPMRALELHPNDRYRVIRSLEINLLTGKRVARRKANLNVTNEHVMIFLDPSRDMLRKRIIARTSKMLEQGLVHEVETLLAAGVSASCKPMSSIGYKQVVQVLGGSLKADLLESSIATATSQYAKRQVTWFKKVPHNYHIESQKNEDAVIASICSTIAKK